jgi:hypothetical protein
MMGVRNISLCYDCGILIDSYNWSDNNYKVLCLECRQIEYADLIASIPSVGEKKKGGLMKKLFLSIMVLFTIGCAEDGKDGRNGVDGRNCIVTQLTNGAEIQCGGSNAIVLNGTDGIVPNNNYGIAELIDPCGDGPGFDEVILRLNNGILLAHYSSGGYEFLTIVSQGNYVTTDKQKCNFHVDYNGNISY